MYQASIARVNSVRPIDGADRIKLASIGGYSVIVGLDLEEGMLVCLFEAGGQLSEEMAQANDLVRRKDENGEAAGGMFEPSRRIKAIKLKGCRSEAFACPLAQLAFTGYNVSQLKEGDCFDSLNGVTLCRKYLTPATRQARGQSQRSNRAETPWFPRHVETESLRRCLRQIPAGAVIHLTAKLHGTSQRLGHVLDDVEIRRGPLARLWARLWRLPTHRQEWRTLHGSRNVILERRSEDETGFYGKEAFRFRATSGIELHKGEVLYGELVGYTDTGASIMGSQSTQELKDKAFRSAFGEQVVYKYGCVPGGTKLFVYRIVQINPDGHAVDLSWPQVRQRADELGLKTVPHLESLIFDGDHDALLQRVSRLVNGENDEGWVASRVDPSHPEEGVVVRYESPSGTGFQKLKSAYFLMMEGHLAGQEAYIDREEAA